MSDSAVRDTRKNPRGEGSGRTSPIAFIRQVIAELRKVVWPTQKELITYFFVVLAFVVVMVAIVSLLDLAFGRVVLEIFAGNTKQ